MENCSKIDSNIKTIKSRIQRKRELIIYSRRHYIEKEGVKEEIDKLEKDVLDLKKELITARYTKFKCVLQ